MTGHKFPIYRKMKGYEIYIRVEETRRTAVELDFGGEKGKCFVEWKYNCTTLDKHFGYEVICKNEFEWAMMKALNAGRRTLHAC